MAVGAPVVGGSVVVALVLGDGIGFRALAYCGALVMSVAGTGTVRLLRALEMRRRLKGEVDWLKIRT
jgi:hypothetical protein